MIGLDTDSNLAVSWTAEQQAAIAEALARLDLRGLGWRGFEDLPWVQSLLGRHPAVRQIAQTASSLYPQTLDPVPDLFAGASPQDRHLMRAFFACKLALEELSCRRAGDFHGWCDKRLAFARILETSGRFLPEAA